MLKANQVNKVHYIAVFAVGKKRKSALNAKTQRVRRKDWRKTGSGKAGKICGAREGSNPGCYPQA